MQISPSTTGPGPDELRNLAVKQGVRPSRHLSDPRNRPRRSRRTALRGSIPTESVYN
ncbi:hypothetical protein Atai01_81270 [Amycolatopsis taiwanensis]|uniref:Uncharacterized protein n=1 Tax=Amycolatopsis taiwanensis TaxID=342230 RepID=A0A9W6R932_9PSEU|nr:hypothetical protein Atai01_81270 [Amycolatopsis taiwanensis]